MKEINNNHLAAIKEAGHNVESGFEALKEQLVCMIEEATHWLSDADITIKLLDAGVPAVFYYDDDRALCIGPDNGPNASFDKAYKDAQLCVERCMAAIKDLDRIHYELVSDPHPQTTSDDTNFGL